MKIALIRKDLKAYNRCAKRAALRGWEISNFRNVRNRRTKELRYAATLYMEDKKIENKINVKIKDVNLRDYVGIHNIEDEKNFKKYHLITVDDLLWLNLL